MGRATVISGGTDGRYVIEMDHGSEQRDALIAKIELDLYQLNLRKTWQEEQLDDVAIGLVSLENEQTAFINAYVAASKLIPPNKELTESIRKQLDAKTAEVIRQQLIVNNARVALGLTNAQIKSAELERAKLEQAEIIEQREAWCADLTENATGTVATLEVPGESALILIKPSAPKATITDGRLIAREVQTPAQVFWNAAVLPGWQKFRPTYRWGTITALNRDANTCSVSLAPAVSSAQSLNVNQTSSLSGVPIVYMDCHAGAFDVGNNVIVEFTGQDWAQPKVIGFLDHPRSCGIDIQYVYPETSSSPSFTAHTFKVRRGGDGPEVTPPSSWGEITHGKWWKWDDGLTTRTRKDLNIQLNKQYTAQYCSMAMLYLTARTLATVGTDTRVSLQLASISDSGTYSPGGFYAHEVLTATFPTLGQAMDWRPSPVEVHRWVPALNTTFAMFYTYNAGLERWVPPVDFAAGSYPGQDYPVWPPP